MLSYIVRRECVGWWWERVGCIWKLHCLGCEEVGDVDARYELQARTTKYDLAKATTNCRLFRHVSMRKILQPSLIKPQVPWWIPSPSTCSSAPRKRSPARRSGGAHVSEHSRRYLKYHYLQAFEQELAIRLRLELMYARPKEGILLYSIPTEGWMSFNRKC